MNPGRAARTQHLGPYFEVQLRLARRMAELQGVPLSHAALRYTNFHRRFGLGTANAAPAAAWLPYAAALDDVSDLPAQVALTQATFLEMPDEVPTAPPRVRFGCFACDPPNLDGEVQIHFHNLDTDADGGPLARAKVSRRRSELAAMINHIGAACPDARAIRGRSWLYNMAAYRRLFPDDYTASATLASATNTLHGNSSWGQMIDSREAVRPELRDALLANLATLDPDAPWRAFPLQVLTVTAPLTSFVRFYGV